MKRGGGRRVVHSGIGPDEKSSDGGYLVSSGIDCLLWNDVHRDI